MARTSLKDLLSQGEPMFLDGAMGTELQRRGIDTGLPLWSANSLMVHPEVVREIHREYIEAGADIITTNTFRTTRRTMRRANLPDRSRQLTRMAVSIAKQAREDFPDRGIVIAGSIAPLEDCYRPDLVPPERELIDEHTEHAERLAENGVDVILLETMNTIREAHAACEAAVATGKEVIVSFICDNNGKVYGGETLIDAVKAIEGLHPIAFSVNCVSPRFISPGLHQLKTATRLPIMLYGNVGSPESDKHGWEFTHDVTADEYASAAVEWRREGVAIIGGCCGTTPEYIHALTHHG